MKVNVLQSPYPHYHHFTLFDCNPTHSPASHVPSRTFCSYMCSMRCLCLNGQFIVMFSISDDLRGLAYFRPVL